jgi:hypothetical protein
MSVFDGGGLTLTASVDGLDEIVTTLEAGLLTIAALSRVVGDFAKQIQAQATLNVSGTQVTYSGGTFIVNRVTGKLSQSFNRAQINPLSAIVVNTASYANAIEAGVDHPVDLKPLLMGKTIPIRTRGMGDAHLAQQNGLATQGPVKGGVSQHKRKNSKKRTSKIEYIAFRKVTVNSKGWVIPPRAPRPFMLAAAEALQIPFSDAIAAAYAEYLSGGP